MLIIKGHDIERNVVKGLVSEGISHKEGVLLLVNVQVHGEIGRKVEQDAWVGLELIGVVD